MGHPASTHLLLCKLFWITHGHQWTLQILIMESNSQFKHVPLISH
jgi:hypothetical protein